MAFVSIILFFINGCLTLDPMLPTKYNITQYLNNLSSDNWIIAAKDKKISLLGLKDYNSDYVIIVSEFQIDIFGRWENHGLVYIDKKMDKNQDEIEKCLGYVRKPHHELPYRNFKDGNISYTIVDIEDLFSLFPNASSEIQFALGDGNNGACYTKGERGYLNYIFEDSHPPFLVTVFESNDFKKFMKESDSNTK